MPTKTWSIESDAIVSDAGAIQFYDNKWYLLNENVTDSYTKLLYHLNEGAGVSVSDSSGQGHTGTLLNMVDPWKTGRFDIDKCVYFAGDNDFIRADDSIDWIYGDNDFEIDMWLYPEELGLAYQVLIGQYFAPSILWRLAISNNDQISYAGGGSHFLTTNANFSLNTWSHIAIVRNGSNCYIYQDGNSLSYGAETWKTQPDCDDYLTIGQYFNSNWFKGRIDELRISHISRTLADLRYTKYNIASPEIIYDQIDAGSAQAWDLSTLRAVEEGSCIKKWKYAIDAAGTIWSPTWQTLDEISGTTIYVISIP